MTKGPFGPFRYRLLLSVAGAVLGTIIVPGTTAAQGFPTRPIQFVAHTSPGGGTDLFAVRSRTCSARKRSFPSPP